MLGASIIPVAEPLIGERELAYVTDAVRSGWVSSKGPYVTAFEAAIARMCATDHAVAVSSGTTGLHLALAALGVGPGDEVIVPAYTFVATASVVRHVGATPVIVDVDPGHWCIDPTAIAQRITPRTKAIIPVHLFGHPAEMDAILRLAHDRGIKVIEDAAEALGAEFDGRPTGGLGDVGVFSFFGNKLITTGEGGMVVTQDRALAERMRMLRDHGMDPERKYWHPEVGFNFRMTNLQAALGVAQAEQVGVFLARKREIGRRYVEALRPLRGLTFQQTAPWANSSFWLFTMLIEETFGMDPTQLGAALLARGVDSRPGFVPLHSMPPYRCAGPYPVADRLGRQALSLPCAVSLTEEQQEYVIESVRELAGTATGAPAPDRQVAAVAAQG